MKRMGIAAAICVLSAAAVSAAAQTAVPGPILAAVADAGRPEADVAADARRHPAETVAFADVRPGMKVAELFPGGGYFSRILAKTVGREGRLYLIPWMEPQTGRSRALAANPVYGNITFVDGGLIGFRPGEPLDMVFTVQNYHDIGTPQRGQANQVVFKSLKRGGVYFIVDHAAKAGSGYAGIPLHRIDEALVRKEVEAAGFVFAGASPVLRNPADDLSKNVFNPEVRGTTDQFALRFVKP